jgi:hypothetical protein
MEENSEECKRQKESALRTHIYNMIGLFVAACGIPAGMRIADMLPEGLGVARLIGVIVLFQLIAKPLRDSYIKSDKRSGRRQETERRDLPNPQGSFGTKSL